MGEPFDEKKTAHVEDGGKFSIIIFMISTTLWVWKWAALGRARHRRTCNIVGQEGVHSYTWHEWVVLSVLDSKPNYWSWGPAMVGGRNSVIFNHLPWIKRRNVLNWVCFVAVIRGDTENMKVENNLKYDLQTFIGRFSRPSLSSPPRST